MAGPRPRPRPRPIPSLPGIGSPSGRGIPLDILAELARMSEQPKHGVEHQLRRIADGEDRDHPPWYKLRPDVEGDVERAQEGYDADRHECPGFFSGRDGGDDTYLRIQNHHAMGYWKKTSL